jgi:nucleotide-binding universal stress UspA family protein
VDGNFFAMRKLIVPTDFSETSKNAARYAVQWAAETGDSSLVLFNAFDTVTAGTDGSLLRDGDSEARRDISLAALNNLKASLQMLAPDVPIVCVAEEGGLLNNLEKLFHHHELDLIVMGITGATKLDQILIGSNTLRVIEHHFAPVLIVPAEAEYRSISRVIFCSDFQDVAASTPVKSLRNLLDLLKPELHVVNVDKDHYVELTETFKAEKQKMEEMLDGYHPKFSFIRMFDFVESVNLYAEDIQADLIITVPRKHGFLSGLFKTSHTKKLAYHSHIPVLAVQE